MKRSINSIYFILIIFTIYLQSCSKDNDKDIDYYYNNNEKTYLVKVENTLAVKFTENINKDSLYQSVRNIAPKINIVWISGCDAKITVVSSDQKSKLLSAMLLSDKVYSCQNFYVNKNCGDDFFIYGEVCIKFLPEITEEKINEIFFEYSAAIILKDNNFYIVKLPKSSDALSIANEIFEKGFTQYSYPNYLMRVVTL